jgi:murein DD-endopeptidase MepM/ murein hydrolase activator NlpD
MRKTPLLSALAFVLVCALIAPATAAVSSNRARRDAARRQAAQLAAQLNTLKASDAQLDRAIAALDAQVAAQSAATRAAESAADAADVALAQAQARLAATTARIAELRDLVARRAVRAYMRPGQETFIGVLRSKDFGEASRRSTILRHVASNDRDVLDRLHAAQEDETIQREAMTQARELAHQRRAAAQAKLAELTAAQAAQRRARAQLDARIREYTEEARQMASLEGVLSARIREDERRLAAQLAPPALGDPGKVSGAGLIWPVRGPVTSGFGMRWGRMHQGIDISAGSGTAIRAAKAGTVTFAGTMSGYGNVITIAHAGGLTTLYAHQSRLAVTGGSVSQGQVIGYVGSTGHSTGPHLHFETRAGGSPQNPMRYLP